MRVWIQCVIVIILLAISEELVAQTCCSGGTPLLGNLGIQDIEPGSFYIQLAYDYNFLNDLYSGTDFINDKSRERLTQTVLLQTIYPITKKFSVNGLFTYVSQQRTIFATTGSTNKTQTSGIGDAVILFQYTLFSDLKRGLTFAMGPKIPIGKFDATDDEFGIVLSPDLQPGSGSFDAIMGTSYQEAHLFNVVGLGLNVSASYRYTTPARRFDGDNKYRFGNEALVSVGLVKNVLVKTIGFSPSVFARYRNTSADRIDKSDVPGTGGNWIYLNPGINIELSNKLAINGSAEIPLYRNLNGTQLTTSYRFNVGLAFKIFRN